MRFCELKEKEVVNICNGKCLGGVVDLQINVCSGAIEALIVPGPGKFCGFFGTDSEYVIPFACIKKIGPDIILVEIKEEKFLQKYYTLCIMKAIRYVERRSGLYEVSILWQSRYKSD